MPVNTCGSLNLLIGSNDGNPAVHKDYDPSLTKRRSTRLRKKQKTVDEQNEKTEKENVYISNGVSTSKHDRGGKTVSKINEISQKRLCQQSVKRRLLTDLIGGDGSSNNQQQKQESTLSTSSASAVDKKCAEYTKRKKKWKLQCFDMKHSELLGKGKFGYVYRTQERTTKQFVALKMISKSQILSGGSDGINVVLLRREIEIHSRLRHQNLLHMYGYFCDDKNCYLILEEAKIELFKHMHKNGGTLNEEQSADYVKQVVVAIQFLQKRHLIHRDIKPENILIGKDGLVKLSGTIILLIAELLHFVISVSS